MKIENKRVIPTVFAIDKGEFNERFNKLIKISGKIQIDLMDGKFVEVKSIELGELPNLRRYNNEFEVHLMAFNPESFILELKKKGFKKIIFHYEAIEDQDRIKNLIKRIQDFNLEAWIAINPETNIAEILPFIHKVDGVLFLGHAPGVEHMNLESNVVEKIEKLRKNAKRLKIQIDGGVNLDNIEKLGKMRVNYVNVGSFISNNSNPKKSLIELERRFAKAWP